MRAPGCYWVKIDGIVDLAEFYVAPVGGRWHFFGEDSPVDDGPLIEVLAGPLVAPE